MANEKLVNRENLKAFRQAYDTRLKDGQLVPALTKGIESISTESGSIQDTPFILQGTGTANGSSIVDTAPIGKHLEKQGNVVCVNQLAKELNSTNFGNNGLISSQTFSNNSVSFIASAQYGAIQSKNLSPFTLINGRKYLFVSNCKLTTATTLVFLQVRKSDDTSNILSIATTNTTNKQYITSIFTASSSEQCYLRFIDTRSSNWDTIQVSNVQLIDLTQWFNGDIPADLLSHPKHWSWYQNYGSYIAYNTGTLVSSNGRYLECGGRNLFNKTNMVISGKAIRVDSGIENNHQTFDHTDYIRIISNTNYCFTLNLLSSSTYGGAWYDKDKNFISGFNLNSQNLVDGLLKYKSPANAKYVRFSFIKTDVDNVVLSLWYSTGEGYNQYYPYEQPKVYDTGTETLLKAGSVKDYKEPNGTIHRLVDSYTFTGEESWYATTNDRFTCTVINSLAKSVDSNSVANAFISGSGLTFYTKNQLVDGNGRIALGDGAVIFIRDTVNITSTTDAQSFMAGRTIYFELATPTTEQGTPFAENIEINDYGTMGWLDTNNAYVDIPQGCKIFYPADYVLFIDSLGQRTDIGWDASEIVSQTELGVVSTQLNNLETELNTPASYCAIANLGSSNTSLVQFSKNALFQTEAQAWEEVTIGSDKFAKFTTWYYKKYKDGNGLVQTIMSQKREDSGFQPYSCFLDENGNILPYILIGRYCLSSTETANSVDASRATMAPAVGRALCQAKGTGFQMMDIAMQMFWRDLALAVSEKVNFNNGEGVASYLGLARMTDGGWWIDGCFHIDANLYVSNQPSKYAGSNDSNPSATQDGYEKISYALPTTSDSWITALGVDPQHGDINVPIAVGGSQTTYYCDKYYYASGNRPCNVDVGNANADRGLFRFYGHNAWSTAYGVRLCYKPIS